MLPFSRVCPILNEHPLLRRINSDFLRKNANFTSYEHKIPPRYRNISAGFGNVTAGFWEISAGFRNIPAGFRNVPARCWEIPSSFGEISAGFRGVPAGFCERTAGRLEIFAGLSIIPLAHGSLYPNFFHIQEIQLKMIPSKRWFPLSLQDRAAWFNNFAVQCAGVPGTALGIPAPTLALVASDNEMMQFLATTQLQADGFISALRQFRDILTEGDIGELTPVAPEAPSMALPVPTAAPGIFERLDDLVKWIRANPKYDSEIGAAMGILPSGGDGLPDVPESELKPTIKANDSMGGYKFTVTVSRMGKQAYKVQVQKKGDTDWKDIAFATSNPVICTLTPTVPGDPERIMVRAILLEKNEQVGVPSDPTYVTVNP
jgi:hypothetical protein